MKKIILPCFALLGANLASAANHSIHYEKNYPEKASFIVQLSGDCKGKIALPVTTVAYGNYYSDNTVAGVVDRNSNGAYLRFRTADNSIEIASNNYTESAGEKIT